VVRPLPPEGLPPVTVHGDWGFIAVEAVALRCAARTYPRG